MQVILPATHDTGSAVVAVPETKGALYISSGTWSLIGVEKDSPVCSPRAMECNVTNEGGVDDRFRVLKNIMGLWMMQEVKKITATDTPLPISPRWPAGKNLTDPSSM